MTPTTCTGRIIGPIPFLAANGLEDTIPLGPCLIEDLDAQRVEVFWGPAAEESAVLALADLETAEASGKLVVLE